MKAAERKGCFFSENYFKKFFIKILSLKLF